MMMAAFNNEEFLEDLSLGMVLLVVDWWHGHMAGTAHCNELSREQGLQVIQQPPTVGSNSDGGQILSWAAGCSKLLQLEQIVLGRP
jgi:hypothetical protein